MEKGMLTYRCYGRHGQGKQERTDGREAAASYLLIEEAVCPICKSRDHVEVESRLYWCTHCRIPLYEKNCPLCHAPAEEFVRDCRIVFPEEKRLLELLMEAEPGTYDHSSVWNGGGIYYADGLRLPLEITKLSEEQIRRAAQKIPEAFRNIDTREFERMRERFVRANCRRFCELETEAVDYIRTSVERYGISKCYVSFSGGKDSTVVAELVRRALGMELMHGFADTTLELPQTLEYIRRYRRSHPDIYFIDAKSRGEQFEALCEILGPPSRVMRWCCTVFKTSALNRRLEMCFPEGEILSFQGIRRAESYGRRKYDRTSHKNKIGRQITASPIIDWQDFDVWLYIATTGIDFNQAYRLGYARVGCWCCPNNSTWSEILAQIYMPQQHRSFKRLLLDFAVKTNKKDPEEYVRTGQWKARLGGYGLAHAKQSVVSYTPCVNEADAYHYELTRPVTASFFELWKPFGWIHRELGSRHLGEVYVLDRDKMPVLRLQAREGDVAVKIVVEPLDRMGTKSRDKARRYVEAQITKYQMCIGCHACEEICPHGALHCDTEGYRINDEKCFRCRKCINYFSGGCYIRKILSIPRQQRSKHEQENR